MGGKVNSSDVMAYTCTSAVPYEGMVVALDSTEGYVDLCGASDHPVGYTFGTTVNPATGSAEAAKRVGIASFKNGDRVELYFSDSNAAIAIGDPICCVGSGLCDKRDGTTNTGDIIGWAEEALAENTGGFSRVKIALIHYVEVGAE
jgi:hypothetical protein